MIVDLAAVLAIVIQVGPIASIEQLKFCSVVSMQVMYI